MALYTLRSIGRYNLLGLLLDKCSLLKHCEFGQSFVPGSGPKWSVLAETQADRTPYTCHREVITDIAMVEILGDKWLES